MSPRDEARRRVEAKRRRIRARKMAAGEAPASVQHGRDSTYVNWGCRCVPCTDAHAQAAARRRQAR